MGDFEEWIDQFLIDHSGDLSEDEAHILETGIQSLTAKLERAKEGLRVIEARVETASDFIHNSQEWRSAEYLDDGVTLWDWVFAPVNQALKDIEND